ncbi:unnamed protein product [Boreogadus saida]
MECNRPSIGTSRECEVKAVKAQLEDTCCEAEGEGGVEDALDDACSPTLHTTLKMSALKPCPVHGTPQAHASSSQSTHRHTSTLSTHQKRVDKEGGLREPGSGRWQWWPQPRNAPILKRAFGRMVAAELRKFPYNAILYRTKTWLMLVLFEAAEGQSSAVFTQHHRSAPYVRPQAGYAADTQPPYRGLPATPHQPHHANAQLPPHPTYSLSPWLHVSQHGPSLAANQDPPGNSEDASPTEDIS